MSLGLSAAPLILVTADGLGCSVAFALIGTRQTP